MLCTPRLTGLDGAALPSRHYGPSSSGIGAEATSDPDELLPHTSRSLKAAWARPMPFAGFLGPTGTGNDQGNPARSNSWCTRGRRRWVSRSSAMRSSTSADLPDLVLSFRISPAFGLPTGSAVSSGRLEFAADAIQDIARLKDIYVSSRRLS